MATLLRGCKPRIPQTLQSLSGAHLRRSQYGLQSVQKKSTLKVFYIDQDAVETYIWASLY